MSRKLIINADDFGISPEVNDAVAGLICDGRLKDVSVVANGWSYEGAAAFLREHPECGAGIHLNAIEGVALSPSDHIKILIGDNGQFVDRREIFVRWIRSPWAVNRAIEYEWRAQIELLLRDGLSISHADSHQHIHAFPPFWRILTRLCIEYRIPAIRYPRERNGLAERRVAAFALGGLARLSAFVTAAGELVSNDHFLGFKRTGTYSVAEMTNDVGQIREGITEMIIHPSLYDGVPYSNMRGEAEFQALQSEELWDRISESGIELISWKDVSAS